jgi:F-type H+-transporting ATPase subunit a
MLLLSGPVTQAIADSVNAVKDMKQEKTFTRLLEHVQDSREVELTPFGTIHLPHFTPITIFNITFDFSPTKHVVFLLAAALVLVLLLLIAARQNKKKRVPTGFGNLTEVFVQFVRDEIVIPNMGKDGIKYLPYLLTTFFFILIMNLAGIVPYGSTPTSNVSVTAGLAIISYIMIQFAAIRAQGLGHYLSHFTGGVPWVLWPIMIPIEILGTFAKAFALCIRLFANMTGGHIVIISLIGLIFIFKSLLIAPLSMGFALGIELLEIFVAFLQAYIFTILTATFMGLGMLSEEHGEGSAH